MEKLPKKPKRIVLPQIRNYIVQPNRVTKSRFGADVGGYTLIQHKILTAIMYYLQEPIHLAMKGHQYNQLEIFSNPDLIKLAIPMSDIGRPDQYREIRDSIIQLASVVVVVPYVSEQGKDMERVTGLIRASIEKKPARSSLMTIEIEKKVADILIKIDRDIDGTPKNYTRHAYEVSQNATCKFTPPIYKLLCSWRKKGEFKISFDELKADLCITSMYKEYYDFKRRVLVPVMNELKEIGDCWFDCTLKSFVEKKRNKPLMLCFKVITPEINKEIEAKADYIRSMLRTNFKFQAIDLNAIDHILKNKNISQRDIIDKIMYLDDQIYKKGQTDDKVKSPKHFVLTSLLNEFSAK